jgi:outer membrane receptor protein involved in Fe transport
MVPWSNCLLVLAVGFIVCALDADGRASEPPEPVDVSETIEIPPVVVTPARREQTTDEADRSVSLVNEEAVRESQGQGVSELLEESTGVFVQRTNRGAGSPIIRGLIGPQNLILIDGIRFNTSTFRTGPNQYLALIDPFAIRRIEVVRGPSSVLYGNGAMGGVMQVFTSAPPFPDGSTTVEGGGVLRFASADLSPGGSAQISSRFGNVSLLMGGTVLRYGPLRLGGGDELALSSYNMAAWRAKIRVAPTSRWSIDASYLGSLVLDAGRVDQLGKGDLRLYDNTDHLASVTARYDGDGVVQRIQTSLSFHRLAEHIDRYTCALSGSGDTPLDVDACTALDESTLTQKRRYDDEVDVAGVQFSMRLGFWEDRIHLMTGGEAYHDWIGSSREDAKADDGFSFVAQSRGNFSDGSTYRSLGAYLFGDAHVVDFGPTIGRLQINSGVRYSHFIAEAPDVPGIGDVSYSQGGLVGSGGVQWLRPGVYNLYASFSQGFRAPNLQESTVLGDTGSKFEVPNNGLQPERNDTIEVGVKASVGPVRLGAAWFLSMLKDVVDEQPTTWEGQSEVAGKPVVQRANVAKGRFQGVEANLSLRFWRMSLNANAAWIVGELTDGDDESFPARRVPPLSGTASLRYDDADARWYALAGMRWAMSQDQLHPSDRTDLRICGTSPDSSLLADPCNGTPGWVSFHVRGGWTPSDWVHLDVGVSNVLDARYRLHGSGQGASGVDARITGTFTF